MLAVVAKWAYMSNEQQQNGGEWGEEKRLMGIQEQNKLIRISTLHSAMLKKLIIATTQVRYTIFAF